MQIIPYYVRPCPGRTFYDGTLAKERVIIQKAPCRRDETGKIKFKRFQYNNPLPLGEFDWPKRIELMMG